MYEIVFYEDEIGYSDITAFIKELQAKSKKNKNDRIQFNKIVAYFDLLEEMGTRMGELLFCIILQKEQRNYPKGNWNMPKENC